MINENTEGRCVLEKALDMLDESNHTEEGNFISNRIEENYQSRRSSSNSEAGWGDSSSYSVKRGSYYSQQAKDELPQELKTLENLNEGIFDAIRHYSISHSLDPTNSHKQQSDEELSEFEQIERTIKDRERAIELY